MIAFESNEAGEGESLPSAIAPECYRKSHLVNLAGERKPGTYNLPAAPSAYPTTRLADEGNCYD